jgi:uncharacterized integral membrane protein
MSLLLVVFTFQNPYPVQMKFMGWQTGQVPVIIIVLISILTGLIISLVLGFKQISDLKKTVRRQKREIEELRMLPINKEEDHLGM